MAVAEMLDCIHGTDLLQFCQACADLVDQLTREYDMQTSGTFPQLTRKELGMKGSKGSAKGGSKKGGGKGC